MNAVTTAIAEHLEIAESLIVDVQRWASVLFVRYQVVTSKGWGVRCRFVSKSVTANIPSEDWVRVATESGTIVMMERNAKRAFAILPAGELSNTLVKEIPSGKGINLRSLRWDSLYKIQSEKVRGMSDIFGRAAKMSITIDLDEAI